MKKEVKTRIKDWIELEIKNKEINEYAHKHIHNFDPILKNNVEEWLSKGIEILIFANTLLEELKKPLVLYLGVFLKPSKRPNKIAFNHISEIKKELGKSSSALYLFSPDQDNYFFDAIECHEIILNKINHLFHDIRSFYSEYFDGKKHFYALWFQLEKKSSIP